MLCMHCMQHLLSSPRRAHSLPSLERDKVNQICRLSRSRLYYFLDAIQHSIYICLNSAASVFALMFVDGIRLSDLNSSEPRGCPILCG